MSVLVLVSKIRLKTWCNLKTLYRTPTMALL